MKLAMSLQIIANSLLVGVLGRLVGDVSKVLYWRLFFESFLRGGPNGLMICNLFCNGFANAVIKNYQQLEQCLDHGLVWSWCLQAQAIRNDVEFKDSNCGQNRQSCQRVYDSIVHVFAFVYTLRHLKLKVLFYLSHEAIAQLTELSESPLEPIAWRCWQFFCQL